MKTLPGRLAIVLALAFVAVAVVAVLIPSSPAGIECGNLVSPDWTDEQTEDLLRQTGDLGSSIPRFSGYNEKCEDARSTRRIVAGVSGGAAVVAPLALFFIIGSAGRTKKPTTPKHP